MRVNSVLELVIIRPVEAGLLNLSCDTMEMAVPQGKRGGADGAWAAHNHSACPLPQYSKDYLFEVVPFCLFSSLFPFS